MKISSVQNYCCARYTNNQLQRSSSYVQKPDNVYTSGTGQLSALPGYKFYPQINFTGLQSTALTLAKFRWKIVLLLFCKFCSRVMLL